MDNHDFEMLYTIVMAEMKAEERANANATSSTSGIKMESVKYASGEGYNFG